MSTATLDERSTDPNGPRPDTDRRRPRRRRQGQRPNVIGGVAAWIWLAVVLLPIYYVLVTSLTAQGSYYTRNPLAPPTDATFDSYLLVLQSGFGTYFLNSAVVTLSTVVVTTMVCLLAAYAIVRSRRWVVRSTYSLFLLGLAIPLQATIIPLFFILGRVGLYDTLPAIILPSIAFAIPITVLILVNFIRDIPGELFEAMRVDGAGQWQVFWRLVLPLVLTQSDSRRVLPLALWNFQGQFSVNVPATLAAVVLSALPLLVLYLLARRQLVAGLTAGAGK